MSERNRGIFFKFVTSSFLILFSVLFLIFAYDSGRKHGKAIGENEANADTYATHANNDIKNRCLKLDPIPQTECIREIINATNEHERSGDDLVAQTEMSLWALGMLIVSVVMAVVTGLGVVFVWRTLVATQQMATDTRNIGEAQSQSYIAAGEARLYWRTRSMEHPLIVLSVSNSGQTPAKWFEVAAMCKSTPNNAGVNSIEDVGFTDEMKFVRWYGIPAGTSYTIPVYSDDDTLEIKKAFDNRLTDGLSLIGKIRYETMFGDVFESEFDFFGRNIRSYVAAETKSVVRPLRPEDDDLTRFFANTLASGEVREKLNKEEPILLKRGTIPLRMHEKVKGRD